MVDFQNSIIFILLCFFSLICYSLLFKKPKNYGCDFPPSPPSIPIIGHLHLFLSSHTHKSLQTLSAKYGSILHLRVFNFPILLVVSPSMAYEIFRTHDESVSSRGDPAVDESLVFGSFGFSKAPYGDYWKFMKKLLVTKLFGHQAQEQSRGVRAAELKRYYEDLLDKATKKQSVEIGNEARKFVINSLCKMGMGRSFSEENNEAKTVMELSDKYAALTKKFVLTQMLRNPFGISPFKKEIMDASNRFDELLERILVEHQEKLHEEEHRGKDMMDTLLVAYRDQNAEYKITRNHIKALFAEFFVGASESSSTTIEWTMSEIINNPRTLERLREEIDSVVGKTRLIQETDLPSLPYLQAVVKEGLRLHPFSPFVVRRFEQGCKIQGFYIPKGTTLLVNAYAMMRDPNSWEDPNEFKPERFLGSSKSGDEEERKEKTLKYLPFGSGRRACTGASIASLVVGTAIGMMVQCFDWQIEGDTVNMDEAIGSLVLAMANPLKCTPLPRTLNPLPSSLHIPNL